LGKQSAKLSRLRKLKDYSVDYKTSYWAEGPISRGESKPEHRSGKRIVAGTAFRLEFQVH